MNRIFFGLPTFETVSHLNRDLSLSNEVDQEGIASTLYALKDLGQINSRDRGSETWFYFDPKENEADNVIEVKLRKSEM
jgi:hypothetical protein